MVASATDVTGDGRGAGGYGELRRRATVRAMSTRERLHDLVDGLPDDALSGAEQALTDAVWEAVDAREPEALEPGDAEAIAEVEAEGAAGLPPIPAEEVYRGLGLDQ